MGNIADKINYIRTKIDDESASSYIRLKISKKISSSENG